MLEPPVQGAWKFSNEGICEYLELWHEWFVNMVASGFHDAGEVGPDSLYPVEGLTGAVLRNCRSQHGVAERCAVQHECECVRVSRQGRRVGVLGCGEEGFKFDVFRDPPDVSQLRPLFIERPLRWPCEPPLPRFSLEGIPFSMFDFWELLDFRLLRDIVLDSDNEFPPTSELQYSSIDRSISGFGERRWYSSFIMDIVLCDHCFTSCVNRLYSSADNGSQQRSMVCSTNRFWMSMMSSICRIIPVFAVSACIKTVSQRPYWLWIRAG